MFIELVDSLRCLTPHEDTWLVAAVTRMEGRHIIEGTLGCPVCRREYPVRDATAWFTSGTEEQADSSSLTSTSATVDDDASMRAAALLGLGEPGGIALLGGPWTAFADLAADRGVSHIVLLNARPSDGSSERVSSIVVEDRLPFANGSVRAAGVGGALATPWLIASAAQALASRGRLVAPASAAVPASVHVLARDETEWVAERGVIASPPVALRSTRRLAIE